MPYLLALFLLFACQGYSEPQKVVYFTMPKGGSQLFRKAISLITERPLRKLPLLQEEDLFPPFLDPKDPTIAYHHLDRDFASIRKDQTGQFIKIIMIRDPRDALISMAHWICIMADTPAAKRFLEIPFEEQISQLICHPDLSMNGKYPYVFDLLTACRQAIRWMEDPSVLVCRFEDLVGPQGGGSSQKQLQALKTLACHLGYDLEEDTLKQIAQELFGNTATFRSGQIGAWREVFTPFQQQLFQSVMGQELIQLGYEP